jgi:hypothetical protein
VDAIAEAEAGIVVEEAVVVADAAAGRRLTP